jgi:SMI1 / KNR4 family (SUKH-1)
MCGDETRQAKLLQIGPNPRLANLLLAGIPMALQEVLSQFLSDLSHLPSTVGRHKIGPVASADEIERLEDVLHLDLPGSFREFLLTQASSFEFDWQLEDNALIRLRDGRESISSGGMLFSLQEILEENPQFRPNYEADDYSQAYRPEPLLAFSSTFNGDQFAVRLSGERAGSIRYLSHDLDDIHMYEVGESFSSFVQNYGRLGFAGPEYWVWEQFTNNRTSPIDATAVKAIEFLNALRTGTRSSEAEAAFARAGVAARLSLFKVMIRPQAQQLLDAKKYNQFVELVKDYSDLLEGAMRARYEFVKKRMG